MQSFKDFICMAFKKKSIPKSKSLPQSKSHISTCHYRDSQDFSWFQNFLTNYTANEKLKRKLVMFYGV